MSSWKTRLAAVFGFCSIEESLSLDVSRNADKSVELAALKHKVAKENYYNDSKVEAANQKLTKRQEEYQQTFKPLLSDIDSLLSAEISYETISNSLESDAHLAELLLSNEANHYGYVGKKLISISLHYELLRRKILNGMPFDKELERMLKDAERPDLVLAAGPMQPFAERGVPSHTAARVEGFLLSQKIEEATKSVPLPQRKQWIDLFRFRTTLSPSDLASKRSEARKKASDFMNYIKEKDYLSALSLADEARVTLEKNDDPMLEDYRIAETAFREMVDPILATNMFLLYSNAVLTCSRFANVEKVIS